MPYWREVNIGSGNGLMPSNNKPLPELMLIQISVAISPGHNKLTYLGLIALIMHKCILSWIINGPGNGVSPVRRQVIIWTNADILSIGYISFKKMYLHSSSPNGGHLVHIFMFLYVLTAHYPACCVHVWK